MFNKILILFVTAMTIAACSSQTPPPAAESKPASYTSLYLPVLADQWAGGIVQLATKEKNGCGQFAANILPDPVDDDYIVEIAGNRDIFFHIARADAQTQCNRVGMFYAVKGNEYLIKFEIKNNRCEFSMLEKTPGGEQRIINTYPAHVSNVDGIKVCANKDNLY